MGAISTAFVAWRIIPVIFHGVILPWKVRLLGWKRINDRKRLKTKEAANRGGLFNS